MTAAYNTITMLRQHLGGRPPSPADNPEYSQKMLHRIPDAEVVDRSGFILDMCRGKKVLDFGASGPMSEAIRKVVSGYYGVDRQEDSDNNVHGFDLDDVSKAELPPNAYQDDFVPDLVVCGEVIEHLANPGWFLTRLYRQFRQVPVLITVPNAFSEIGARYMRDGIENVNFDHCWWPSFRTLRTLLGRAGYTSFRFCWYGGRPLVAEGIIMLCEAQV